MECCAVSERFPSPELPRLNESQELALQGICERYGVSYDPDDYLVWPSDGSYMPGWAEGWVGGHQIQAEHSTLYIGVSPEGQIHS